MGKLKQRRHRGARYNPTGVDSNGSGGGKDIPGPAAPTNQAAGLRLVQEKLESVVVEEKVCGLNTLAALALEDNAPTTIVAGGSLIEKVAALLRDTSVEVRVAAAGTLRNISAGGSDEVVEVMVQQDVLTPLAELIRTYASPWSPATTDLGQPSSRQMDPMSNTFIHATHLLWNICECNEEAVSVFNREGLIHILVTHLDPSAWGDCLALAAAECLLCVSENNPPAASALLPVADTLVSYVSRLADKNKDLRFATTLSGVLLNINYCGPSDNGSQLILRTLAATLRTDPVNEIKRLITEEERMATQGGHTESENGKRMEEDPAADNATSNGLDIPASNTASEDLTHLISAQQLAFELLSNMCWPDEGESSEEDWEECGSLSGEEGEESMEVAVGEQPKDVLPPEVVEGLRHYQLFQTALSRASPLDPALSEQGKTYAAISGLIAKLRVLRLRALLCVQSLAGVLQVDDMGGSEAVYATWLNLGTVAFRNSCTDSDVLEGATGAMRAIMDRLSQDHCHTLTTITQQDLQEIFEAGVSCREGNVRANVARMVGTLASLVVTQTPTDAITQGSVGEVLTAVTNFLFKVAAHDSLLWVSAEALDVLIDLYSDDKTDCLAHQTSLVDRLKGIHPQFKAKHKANKKSLGEHRALVLTVKGNLVGFIKYKAPRAAKFRKS